MSLERVRVAACEANLVGMIRARFPDHSAHVAPMVTILPPGSPLHYPDQEDSYLIFLDAALKAGPWSEHANPGYYADEPWYQNRSGSFTVSREEAAAADLPAILKRRAGETLGAMEVVHGW